MRLGQLSRKISVRSNEIVTFLSKHGISIEDSTNARVDDAHVKLILSHFAPALLEQDPLPAVELASERGAAADVVQPLADPSLVDEPAIKTPAAEPEEIEAVEPSKDLAVETPAETVNEVNGVIKPPKVELQGLKVLGKIELPEVKKKEPEQEVSLEEGTQPVEGSKDSRRKRDHQKPVRRTQERRGKNPVALERERRAREQEEQRQRQAELEKERKANHYYKRVKPKGPTKAARIHDEQGTAVEEGPDQPKTLWGKFMRWLTSY